jgi:hypothetical protein
VDPEVPVAVAVEVLVIVDPEVPVAVAVEVPVAVEAVVAATGRDGDGRSPSLNPRHWILRAYRV